MKQDIAYKLDNSLYLNITNRCTNECQFCIRNKCRNFNKKYPLWLDSEPTAEEVLREIGDSTKYKEIVFCGYGEPLIRLETVKEVAQALRPAKVKIRIDTNGHANLFYGRNILLELKGLVDKVSVSLNAENSEVYEKICNSFFGKKAFDAVIDFIRKAKEVIPEVEVTVVDMPQLIDIEKSRNIAKELGVPFRVRPYYEEEYVG